MEETPGADDPGEIAQDARESPYRNLWVPLVVVPFIVVGVIVIVYVFVPKGSWVAVAVTGTS